MEKVKDRMRRTCEAFELADVPYAIADGNAVAAWVATVDEAAVRNTADVDVVINRRDMEAAIAAMGKAGFVYRYVSGVDMFLDQGQPKARDAVHVVYGGEKVRDEYPLPAPESGEAIPIKPRLKVLELEALVRMKLTSFRRKDQVHIQDMISVGLITPDWLGKYSEPPASRLQELLDDPEG